MDARFKNALANCNGKASKMSSIAHYEWSSLVLCLVKSISLGTQISKLDRNEVGIDFGFAFILL